MTGLFTSLFVPDAMREAVSDRAYVQAMLDFEAALARAEARAGAIPADAAQAIAACCDADRFDPAALGREGRASGTPVVPLVRALGEAVRQDAAGAARPAGAGADGPGAAGEAGSTAAGADRPGAAGEGRPADGYVHWGATSQDVLDTAAMLVAHRAVPLILADVEGVAAACAKLARAHRAKPMAGRTALQQAVPITFGFKAAGWLAGVVEARRPLTRWRAPVQLGGAAGTLASLGDRGLRVLAHLARELDLAEPPVPWHTARAPVAELGAALAIAAGALGKIALDLTLLAQTEVGEVAEGQSGGSSTMPHKRNPAAAIRARACATRAPAPAGTLLQAMAHEHERAAGAWQAEWEALREALALTGGAAAALREALEGLEIDAQAMRDNLDRTQGLLLSEHVMMALAEHVGRDEAKRRVEEACERAVAAGRPLRAELHDDSAIRLSPDEIAHALDPTAYLGSADAFIDRALERYGKDT